MQSLQDFQQRQELVAKGSRMEALDTATDDILKAAKQLEREVRRETKFWQEVVSISDKGWPIQRMRQNARNVPFGVRYGLPEGMLVTDLAVLPPKLTVDQPADISRLVVLPPCAWTRMAASSLIQRSH